MESKDQIISYLDKPVDQITHSIYQKIDIWSKYVVFSGLWWMGVALTIIPWIIWFIYRKKQSTDRLMYVALYVMVISLVLDITGDQLGLWHYRFNVVPFLPTYVPWDLTLMPFAVIVFIQIYPNANPWIKAIIFALFSSYLAEPFFSWLEVYNPIHWKYSYSVPIQIAIYMSAHYLSRRNKFSNM